MAWDGCLSMGVIKAIIQDKKPLQEIGKPVFQVLAIKKILGPNGEELTPARHRIVISDGIHLENCMLATQQNQIIFDDKLQARCIVRLDDFIQNEVRGLKILIVLRMECLTPPLEHIIGNPLSLHDPSNILPNLLSSFAPTPAFSSSNASRGVSKAMISSRKARVTTSPPNSQIENSLDPFANVGSFSDSFKCTTSPFKSSPFESSPFESSSFESSPFESSPFETAQFSFGGESSSSDSSESKNACSDPFGRQNSDFSFGNAFENNTSSLDTFFNGFFPQPAVYRSGRKRHPFVGKSNSNPFSQSRDPIFHHHMLNEIGIEALVHKFENAVILFRDQNVEKIRKMETLMSADDNESMRKKCQLAEAVIDRTHDGDWEYTSNQALSGLVETLTLSAQYSQDVMDEDWTICASELEASLDVRLSELSGLIEVLSQTEKTVSTSVPLALANAAIQTMDETSSSCQHQANSLTANQIFEQFRRQYRTIFQNKSISLISELMHLAHSENEKCQMHVSVIVSVMDKILKEKISLEELKSTVAETKARFELALESIKPLILAHLTNICSSLVKTYAARVDYYTSQIEHTKQALQKATAAKLLVDTEKCSNDLQEAQTQLAFAQEYFHLKSDILHKFGDPSSLEISTSIDQCNYPSLIQPEQNYRLTNQLLEEAHPFADQLICPISMELMIDPVSASDGHTYERQSIESWLSEHCTSPRTNLPLSTKILTPNWTIRSIIQQIRTNFSSKDSTSTSTSTLSLEASIDLDSSSCCSSSSSAHIEESFALLGIDNDVVLWEFPCREQNGWYCALCLSENGESSECQKCGILRQTKKSGADSFLAFGSHYFANM